MEDNERIQFQQEGVNLTREGDYTSALWHFKVALEGAKGVLRANILRDMADAIRRLPPEFREGYSPAECLNESLDFLNPMEFPVEYASALHFFGRLLRQAGNYALARDAIFYACDLLRDWNTGLQDVGKPANPEELYARLDAASINALLGDIKESRRQARESIHLINKYGWGSSEHRKRARIIWLFAWWPNAPFKSVRRAFFGRTFSFDPSSLMLVNVNPKLFG